LKYRSYSFGHSIALSLAVALLTLASGIAGAKPGPDDELLKVREQVWRAWFANDVKALTVLVPEDTIVISAGDEGFKHQKQVLEEAAAFQKSGGKLLRLEFPKTEVQHFGDVAIIWSEYSLDTEVAGKKSTSVGRVTEIFVHRNGQWTNPGWHTDAGK
jgi:ketosteroid isomerase-like protein